MKFSPHLLVTLVAAQTLALPSPGDQGLTVRQLPPQCTADDGTTIFGQCECLCGGPIACGTLPGDDGFDCSVCAPATLPTNGEPICCTAECIGGGGIFTLGECAC
ncbi:hypothetical protein F5884DRAFT_779615 [Xylogone sp. PMI_703]|nr:hypothetical protein F5884DRAFT_779615 [Xylogone sp. PMI_703]